ncbi:MAG: hypothetical protein KBT47_00050, partial [Armatimonadetes bacterium]|nr:hypothetical protein [Candidatus Hippobium faecium]
MKTLIFAILAAICLTATVYAQTIKAFYLYAENAISITYTGNENDLSFEVADSAGKTILSDKAEFQGNIAKIPFNSPNGNYTLILKKGHTIIGKSDFTKEEAPKWLNNKLYVTDDNWCPKPWFSPIVKGYDIQVTDRTYSLNSQGFFDSVTALGDNILSGNIEWHGTVNGKELVLKPKSLKITKKTKGCIYYKAECDSEYLTMETSGKIEFDGYCEADTTFKTKSDNVTVEKLYLNIPYKNEYGTLCHYFPKVPVWYGGVNVTKLNSGYTQDGWQSEHLPFIWIGNEDKGMQWLTETDENWKLSNPEKALLITKNAYETVLTLNIIDKPWKAKKEFSYPFSFMASPVKPKNNHKYDYHYTNQGGLMDVIKYSAYENYDYLNLKGYNAYGVNNVCCFTWTEALGNPAPTLEDNAIMLRAARDITKLHNLKFFLFQVFLVSERLPEFKYFDEVKVVDKNAYNCPGEYRRDTCYAVCQNTMWQDYWIKGIFDTIDEYDLDGLYTDSVPTIGYCANLNHGCGYVDEDGTVKPTVKFRSVRNLLKRIYRGLEVRRDKKELMYIGHVSASVYLPTISFCDFYLDTEHMMPIPRPFRVPLDSFRAEFMGNNFGVPSQCFSYEHLGNHREANLGVWRDEMFALGLLHDSDYCYDMEISTYRWQAQDDFGMSDVTFNPYWKEIGVKSPEGVYVSYYSKPGTDDLLVYVANFTEENITGSIDLGKPVSSFKGYYNTDNSVIQNGNITDTFESWKGKI